MPARGECDHENKALRGVLSRHWYLLRFGTDAPIGRVVITRPRTRSDRDGECARATCIVLSRTLCSVENETPSRMASRFLPASQTLPAMGCVPTAVSWARNRLGSASNRNSRIRCCGSGWIAERRAWQIGNAELYTSLPSR